MYDSLLNLIPLGTAGPATITGDGKALGRNRSFIAEVGVGGDITGAGASMTCTIEESNLESGGTWTQIGAGPAITAEQVGGVSGATPRPEIPGLPRQTIGFTTSKDFVRAILTMAGTTPSFPRASVTVTPNDTAVKRSGAA